MTQKESPFGPGTENNPITAEMVEASGLIYARNADGGDLAAKTEDAYSRLPASGGEIIITQKPDGSGDGIYIEDVDGGIHGPI